MGLARTGVDGAGVYKVWKIVAAVCMLAFLMLGFLAGPARADTFEVNSLSDPGTGGCDANECTLREAIEAANDNAEPDEITFSVTGQITLNGTQLVIEPGGGPLSINGPGVDQLTVSGDQQSRVFEIQSGAEAVINGLTVADGETSDDGSGLLKRLV
ncbi:MAG: CSLREA domain-containing protein [Rubrobacteraceae bacterium]